jgi:phage RecT family recombinase
MTESTALTISSTAKHALGTRDISGFLRDDDIVAQLSPFVEANGISYSELIAQLKLAVLRDPKILACSPESIVNAVATALGWNLEIGETVYLINYKGKLTPVASYRGLAHLMRATGAVRDIHAYCVYANEIFDHEQGSNAYITHRPMKDPGDRGALIGAYWIAKLPHQYQSFEWMRIEEIDEIRHAHSKQWASGPCPSWWAEKAMIRRAAKLFNTNLRLKQVFEEDERVEFGEQPLPKETPDVPLSPADEDDDSHPYDPAETADVQAEWVAESSGPVEPVEGEDPRQEPTPERDAMASLLAQAEHERNALEYTTLAKRLRNLLKHPACLRFKDPIKQAHAEGQTPTRNQLRTYIGMCEEEIEIASKQHAVKLGSTAPLGT